MHADRVIYTVSFAPIAISGGTDYHSHHPTSHTAPGTRPSFSTSGLRGTPLIFCIPALNDLDFVPLEVLPSLSKD